MQTNEKDKDSDSPPHHQQILLTFVVVGAALVLIQILKFGRHGVNFTDSTGESFYLAWMAKPFAYDWSLSYVGLISCPLYRALEGNVAHLRQTNIASTSGAGALSPAQEIEPNVSRCPLAGEGA